MIQVKKSVKTIQKKMFLDFVAVMLQVKKVSE